MALSAGDRLGPYEIVAPLGAGGMGEVYRATDTKLERAVAIKVLPDALAQDPDRLARFAREAKVLASLNHPHIAQIYGIEDRALVMELVPGATLRGPLPLATGLEYAKQIAEALEAAHEKGIVHRDLKPGNVMVTPEGVVKVLDFGLAAIGQDPESSSADQANSPTLTVRATQAGMILGTAAYMSPEQAAGKPVDKRSDIWSFGVVLYEMLTGQRLFGGETISHTLADVLKGDIDLGRLPKDTPRAVRDLLRRCLERDVKMRLRDIGEARIAIQQCLAHPEPAIDVPLPAKAGPARLPWAVARSARWPPASRSGPRMRTRQCRPRSSGCRSIFRMPSRLFLESMGIRSPSRRTARGWCTPASTVIRPACACAGWTSSRSRRWPVPRAA